MPNAIPQHVAIIMDGNGRWAKKQGLLRVQGHEVGVQRVEEIIQAAKEKGIRYLTLYAFSKENWRRPKEEVQFLMGLLSSYLDKKIQAMIKKNCVFNVIGEIGDLVARCGCHPRLGLKIGVIVRVRVGGAVARHDTVGDDRL